MPHLHTASARVSPAAETPYIGLVGFRHKSSIAFWLSKGQIFNGTQCTATKRLGLPGEKKKKDAQDAKDLVTHSYYQREGLK